MAETTKHYTVDDVRQRLRTVLDTKYQGSPERMAVKLGCTAAYVRMIVNGNRNPPQWACRAVGLKPVTVYRELRP